MNALPPRAPRAHIGDTLADLAHIADPTVNLAIWQRQLPTELADAAESALAAAADLCLRVPAQTAGEAVAAKLAERIPRAAAERLAIDVALLARVYAAITGHDEVHIDLEVLRHDPCRLFHVDRVDYRLITTYLGRGTHWLAEANLDRDGLGQGSNRLVVRSPHRVQKVATGAVALFAGSLAPGRHSTAIVHRSPPIARAGEVRLVLKIDRPGPMHGY